MGAILALAVNGFREARRNRVSSVAVAFAIVLLLGSTLVTEVTVYTMVRVLTDFGLGTMALTLTLLAIFLSTSQLVREIERRTIFLVVSKPVSRLAFVMGRFSGTMATLGVLLVLMGGIFLGQVALYGAPITAAMVAALGMLWFELLVLTAFGFLMSSFAGQIVSAIVTTGVFFAGHLSSDIYTLSRKSASAPLRALGKGVYYALPNLDRLDFRPAATYGVAVHAGELASAIAYAVAYSALLLTIAVFLFSRRDFK